MIITIIYHAAVPTGKLALRKTMEWFGEKWHVLLRYFLITAGGIPYVLNINLTAATRHGGCSKRAVKWHGGNDQIQDVKYKPRRCISPHFIHISCMSESRKRPCVCGISRGVSVEGCRCRHLWHEHSIAGVVGHFKPCTWGKLGNTH